MGVESPNGDANNASWLRKVGLACKACGADIFVFVLTGSKQGFQLESQHREGYHNQICFGKKQTKTSGRVPNLHWG